MFQLISKQINNLHLSFKLSVLTSLSWFWLSGRVVFHIPDWLHHLLAAGRILLKNTFEAYMDQYMQTKLDRVLQEHRMVSLITQLRGRVSSGP